jgi:hypothetical protein
MQPPPRDASGRVIPHDHDEIAAEHGVIRRVSEQQIVVDRDGQRTLSSIAFSPSAPPRGGMSVDLEKLMQDDDIDPKAFVTTPRWIGSVIFRAGDLRNLALQVGYDPLPEMPGQPANPYHGEVWGTAARAKRKEVKALAAWYVPIPGVAL